jgi:hypothetical protein
VEAPGSNPGIPTMRNLNLPGVSVMSRWLAAARAHQMLTVGSSLVAIGQARVVFNRQGKRLRQSSESTSRACLQNLSYI